MPVPIFNATEPGYLSGLKLYLKPKTKTSAITIYIHNPYSNIAPKKGILVSPGVETSLILNKVSEDKLPYPFSQCQKELKFKLSEMDIFNR